MKAKELIVMFCLILIGYNSQCQTTYMKQMKESYLYDFKMSYFKTLLYEAFNRSNEIKKILLLDRSGYGEMILSYEDNKLIDSLVKIDNQIMVRDSLNTIGRVGEGAEGKHVFVYAIGRYQSKWLDSIANARCKIFLRNHKKD